MKGKVEFKSQIWTPLMSSCLVLVANLIGKLIDWEEEVEDDWSFP